MLITQGPVPKARNRNYRKLHQHLIEAASNLISQSGADGVSLSALARVTGINRTTIYYHFESRAALMSAAHRWSREQQPIHADVSVPRWVDTDDILGRFRRNPNAITSWMNDCIGVDDIRERYPKWDRLVAQISDSFAELAADEPCDTEDYCRMMLAGAFSVPSLFASPVHPLESLERMLKQIYVKTLAHAAGIALALSGPHLAQVKPSVESARPDLG